MIVLVFYFFILLDFFLMAGGTPIDPLILQTDCNNSAQTTQVLTQLPASFMFNDIRWHADIMLDPTDFFLLLGFEKNTVITPQLLEQGISNLRQKNKFNNIELTVTGDPTCLSLSFDLKSFWTVHHVYIKGALLGKEKYKHHYRLEPGEHFDKEKHTAGLATLLNHLKSEGYLQAQIKDTIDYKHITKEVTVHLHIIPGNRFTIQSVTIQGIDDKDNNHAHKMAKKIQKMLTKELKGAYYHEPGIQKQLREIKNYLFSKGYLHASLTEQCFLNKEAATVELQYELHLKDRSIIDFIGNHFFTKEQLTAVIMPHGSALSLIPTHLFTEDFVALYKKNGFLNVSIVVSQDNQQSTFSINEGQRACIAQIVFKNVTQFPTAMLIKECFGPLLKHRYYDAELIQKGRDALLHYYHEAGFWDASIVHEYNENIANDQITLVFNVHEGPQRWYVTTVLDPLFANPDKELFKTPGIPEPFRLSLLNDQRQWLMHYLHNHGYLYAKLIYNLEEHDHHLTVYWQATGNVYPVVFGNTIIQTNALPSPLILRELAYKKGELWHQAQINKSLKNLTSLGIFESVSLHPIALAHPEHEKKMLLNYVEDSPYELRGRAGFQVVGRHFDIKTATIKVGASFLYKNVTNTADTLKIDANYTRFERDARLCYHMPWLGPYPIKTDIKLYSISYDQPIKKGLVEQLYRAIQDGFLFSFMHRTDHGEHTCNVGFEWMETTGLSQTLARKIDFEPALIGKKVPYFFIEPTLFIDYLDNQLNPTSGCLSLISLKSMVPFHLSRAFFIKILAEHSFFVPFISHSILAIRLRAGHIFNQAFKKIMPPERFYLGGAYSLRSYDPDMVPPLNCYTDQCSCTHTVPLGGRTMANANIELRFPLYQQLSGVIFQDAGILLQDHFATITLDSIATATGAGLRLNTPVGPLRFDIGWKWKKSYPQESRFAWFLTLGNAF